MMGDAVLESLLRKVEDLKVKVHGSKNIFTDKDAQQYEQELRMTYKSILLQDLDFALKLNVEEHLWRSGFKVSIDFGRKINPDGFLVWSSYGRKKAESQKLFEDCLRTGAKFYKNLLMEICATFDFNIPFLSDLFEVHEVCNVPNWEESGYKKPEKWSMILMCQNCLTHMGNCIRYEVEYDRAHVLYQLRGELSIPKTCIPNFTKYGHVFLVLLGCLCMASARQSILSALVRHLLLSLKAFVVNDIRGSVKICRDSLIRMFAMSVFVLQDTRNGFPLLEGQHIFKSDPEMTRAVVLDLVAGTLETLLKPLPELKVEKLLSFRGLPTVKLTLDFIRTEPGVLKEKAFQSRPGIWSSLGKVLNEFADVHNYFDDKEEQFRTAPLPEDRELEGFTVLQPVLSELTFINCVVEGEPEIYNDPAMKFGLLRAHRLSKFGQWLTQQAEMNLSTSFDLCKKNDGAIVQLDPVTSHELDAASEQMYSSDNSHSFDYPVAVSLLERLMMMNLAQPCSTQPSKPRLSTSSRLTAGTNRQRHSGPTRFSGGSDQDQTLSGSNPPSNGPNQPANERRSRRKRSGRKRRRRR